MLHPAPFASERRTGKGREHAESSTFRSRDRGKCVEPGTFVLARTADRGMLSPAPSGNQSEAEDRAESHSHAESSTLWLDEADALGGTMLNPAPCGATDEGARVEPC